MLTSGATISHSPKGFSCMSELSESSQPEKYLLFTAGETEARRGELSLTPGPLRFLTTGETEVWRGGQFPGTKPHSLDLKQGDSNSHPTFQL